MRATVWWRAGRRSILSLVALATSLAASPAAGEMVVTFDSPSPFDPVRGEVEIAAAVGGAEAVERVVFSVDGMAVGERVRPPYRLTVDVGPDNAEHTFVVVAYGVAGGRATASRTTPRLRIDEEISVSLQQFYVTVSRAGGRVLDLAAGEFELLEDGRPRELVTFARGDVPFTAVVLVDASVSMAGEKLAAALEGARSFFDGMRPLDEGRLVAFSDRTLHATPFTSFPEVLSAGLDRVRARGGTTLNDQLYLALRMLEARQGRRVVLLLSDGVDSHSVLSMADALALVRRSQALVYWLRLPYAGGAAAGDTPVLTTAWRSSADYRSELRLLRRAVADSGGRTRTLASTEGIPEAFAEILAELRDQYVLGFYPDDPRHDGSWRRVRIAVRRPGLEVRARDGYLDD